MLCQESEEEQSAPLQPSFTAPTKSISNDWAVHGGPDADKTDSESDVNVQKEFDESTGMLRLA
jgi:hypothetical protein